MRKNLLLLLLIVVLINSCQKEVGYDTSGPAGGSLKNTAGNCLPKVVDGTYSAGTALGGLNTISVDVAVTQTGKFTVYTDTLNGYFFRATGVFSTPGTSTVILHGQGTPLTNQPDTFTVRFGASSCELIINVGGGGGGGGGGGTATYTLAGAPTACTPITPAGTYVLSAALTATNTVTIKADVTVLGTFTITTNTVGGMTFAKTGTFTVLGLQDVILAGAGTPTTVGANNFTVTAGAPVTSSCTFAITVSGTGAVGTLGSAAGVCTPSTPNGTYTVGVPLVAATNTVTVQVNVTTPGAYTITTNTVTGFSFSASGNFPASGAVNVNLVGTGTPTTAGPQTFTVTFGTSTCTVVITVAAPPPATGTINCAGATVNGFYVVNTAFTSANTIVIPVTVATTGSYTISTNTVTGFSFSGTGTFPATGAQNVTLNPTGTPTTAGVQTFLVTWGTSSCNISVTVLPNDYFPRTTNSNWSYEWNDDLNDSLQRYVIAPTHTAISNTWNIFLQKDGVTPPPDSSGYYRRATDDYYEWFDYGSFVGFDNPGWSEYIMVKGNSPNNTNWKSGSMPGLVGGTPLTIRFSYTIVQKDVPVTVVTSLGTKNYVNVIVVEEKIEVEVTPGVWQDATATIDYYGKSYYARGVGLIKFEAYDAGNTLQDLQELRRFQIF